LRRRLLQLQQTALRNLPDIRMNYFAHALPFLEDPYFIAGTGVPDWLMVVDRQSRVRLRGARACFGHEDPLVDAVARGAAQHLCDDARFHETRAFAELSWGLTAAAKDLLGPDTSMRPSFLGHLLVELLLDATLIAEDPRRLDRYYELLDAIDAAAVQAAVNCFASRPAERLAWMIERFREARVLGDYLDDARLMVRLNQVMRRVGMAPLPDSIAEILPAARQQVAERRGELLEGIPAAASGK
jgi:hypothetical protein